MLIPGCGGRRGPFWGTRKQGLLLRVALALGACAAPASAQTYVGNNFSSGSSLLSALETDGNSDQYPPFVILQEYSPSGPATTGAIFGSAGTVNDVSFYGSGNYDFTVYALALNSSSAAKNEQTFSVVGDQTFSGDATIKGVQNLAANFSVGAGDYLAFAGTGPWYPQAPNNAVGSDATYESSSERQTYPTSFTAIAPNAGQTFTVGAHGDSNATYQIVPNPFQNQGRSYAIGVTYTQSSQAGGSGGGGSGGKSDVFFLSANTPITFTEGQGTTGDSFVGQCSTCVEGLFGTLNKPLGLSIEGFDLGPGTPATEVQEGGTTLYEQTLQGDLNFELLNPDGSTLLSGGRAPPITIEGYPGESDVLLEITIPAPVTINDDTDDLQLPPGFQLSPPGNLYIAIYGQLTAGQELQIADVGSPYVSCTNTPMYCSESFLGFTMDATIEMSTSPISFNSVFPSAIPEPSTWAMLAIGFAGLGFAGWRQGRARDDRLRVLGRRICRA